MANKTKSPAGLQKIAVLLKQMGISEEATKEFTAVCEKWQKDEKEKLQQEFKVRLDKAKKVCVEEVEDHKARLSRGVKMFLENQGKTIREASQKQAAIAESEAIEKLKKVHALLGGIDIDGAANAQALQAESKKNAELVSRVAELAESLDREKAKSAKLGELSEKSLARQKDLEKSLNESKSLLSEARDQMRKHKPAGTKTISEKKVASAKPVSAKRTPVSESDVGNGKKVVTESTDDIDIIAASMD